MRSRSTLCVACTVALAASPAAGADRSMGLRQLAARADRVVHGAATRQLGTLVTAGGREITLGERVVLDGRPLVVRRFRVEVERCLFDENDACATGDLEVWVPGGTVWQDVRGTPRLVDVHVTDPAVGAPPALEAESVLFLERSPGSLAWRIVPDRNARLPVSRLAGDARVEIAVDDPRLLSDEARRDPRNLRLLASRGRRSASGGDLPHEAGLLRDEVTLDALAALVERARSLAPSAAPGPRP